MVSVALQPAAPPKPNRKATATRFSGRGPTALIQLLSKVALEENLKPSRQRTPSAHRIVAYGTPAENQALTAEAAQCTRNFA